MTTNDQTRPAAPDSEQAEAERLGTLLAGPALACYLQAAQLDDPALAAQLEAAARADIEFRPVELPATVPVEVYAVLSADPHLMARIPRGLLWATQPGGGAKTIPIALQVRRQGLESAIAQIKSQSGEEQPCRVCGASDDEREWVEPDLCGPCYDKAEAERGGEGKDDAAAAMAAANRREKAD